jgi:hypothetical protein
VQSDSLDRSSRVADAGTQVMMSITNVCSNIVVTPGGIVVKRGCVL